MREFIGCYMALLLVSAALVVGCGADEETVAPAPVVEAETWTVTITGEPTYSSCDPLTIEAPHSVLGAWVEVQRLYEGRWSDLGWERDERGAVVLPGGSYCQGRPIRITVIW